ncbi:hypothetical protein BGZ82_006169 [Podila clonocystis]|nr:hypothetical protein BGZ82_006169 [Podila clonocystis]
MLGNTVYKSIVAKKCFMFRFLLLSAVIRTREETGANFCLMGIAGATDSVPHATLVGHSSRHATSAI